MPIIVAIIAVVFILFALLGPIGWAGSPIFAIPVALLLGGTLFWPMIAKWYRDRPVRHDTPDEQLRGDYGEVPAASRPVHDVPHPDQQAQERSTAFPPREQPGDDEVREAAKDRS